MSRLTIDALRTILVACAGADDDVEFSDEALDVTFEELGYDSLALMESAARIEREYGIELSDDEIDEGLTPRRLLAIVNENLSQAA
ncbi:acyl carrier protein [Streptomyces sp. LaPpAH-108]|uniref:acyl carrier protein n=1 Tax=Streptomyces sp. LaPpAH-108 TaxID=1155714 RepID=UPI00036CE1CA|nr:acyl carrier protein [Streptomyces sp. LaPpAH-108]